jgi:putative ABC transport system substrate-binding protein
MRLTRRAVLVGAAAFAAGAHAQPARPRRIGWISTEPQPDPFIAGFREGLQALGYAEGQNLVLELRYATGDFGKLQAAIAELKALNVAFIVSSGPAIQAIKTHRDVQVLFAISGDPVELGVAQTLARPGSNFTGSTFLSLEIAAKRVELLREALPELRRLAVLSNTNHPGEQSEWRATRRAAEMLDIETIYVPFAGPAEFDGALGAVRAARGDAMITFPDGITFVNRQKIAAFAEANSLPSMFGWSEHCDAGGLMSYGANQRETYVRLATYADRMLRGERAGDLPIQQPTTFELVMNAGTAKRLGVNIAQPMWTRADRLVD